MESTPEVSKQQIEYFLQSLRRNYGWELKPDSKLRKTAENYGRRYLNDGCDIGYHVMMFRMVALGQRFGI